MHAWGRGLTKWEAGSYGQEVNDIYFLIKYFY